jgi:predicted anti-sigma-YlaC factor YlaD
MTPRCQEVLDRLIEAATGSVPPRMREGIAEHLAVCPRCRDEAAAIERTVAVLRTVEAYTSPPGFWIEFTERLQQRIAAGRRSPVARLRRWWASPRRAWATSIAALALAIAVAAIPRLGPAPSTPTDPVAVAARALITETMTRTLPSLAEMLETMRAGLSEAGEPGSERRPP